MKLKSLGERELIALIRQEFSGRRKDILLGIGDDAAVLRPGKYFSVITKDLLVENVDFIRRLHPAFYIGRKSLNVNLSDIAAMGAAPKYALLGLGLPRDLSVEWIQEFLAGFKSAARRERVALVGGDISKASKITISVTVIGEGQTIVRRDGARSGDLVFVSGTLGDAKLGFMLMNRGATLGRDRITDAALRAFLDPVPRVALGQKISGGKIASSMIDTSDGLSVDLMHLCEESGTGAEIDLTELPLSAGMKAFGGRNAFRYALHGGEDFELLFTVRPRKIKAVAGLQRIHKITPIGRIIREKGIFAVDRRGRRMPLAVRGYEHFK
jgi:thiamine-monophosphate kinase